VPRASAASRTSARDLPDRNAFSCKGLCATCRTEASRRPSSFLVGDCADLAALKTLECERPELVGAMAMDLVRPVGR